MKKQFRVTLKAARVSCGLSQKEASYLLGVHYQTLASWERDSSDMPHSKIKEITQIYEMPMKNIFFGDENEFIRSKKAVTLLNKKLKQEA